ncbi:flagellin lysine-N-methylase [Cohnella massiliensis]|uniref:flagellin lysine-N-methylase n=1 Tax=Cohnella massiliensis TaxID=1816691 RepID=UPI0009BB0B56|nr:flagellin lysine-N-methylase [Cohnella massiliensis]
MSANMTTDQKALMPEYMKDFKCIGAECEDTCCAGWRVSIDQQTMGMYHKSSHAELSKKFKTEIVLNPVSERTATHYARMNVNPSTGNCSFLTEGMCSIQAALGEDYLSQTCATYPRVVNVVNELQEVSTQLSCPEAARVVLLNPRGIQFYYEDKLTWRNLQFSSKFSTEHTKNQLARAFWDIRVAAIRIMQDRRYHLEHRFMQLAVLADQIQESLDTQKAYSIPQIIESFFDGLDQGSELNEEAAFPVDPQFQLKLTNKILLTILEKKLWHNVRYEECLNDYLAGMQEVNEQNIAQVTQHFNRIKHQFYEPFIKEYAYIFENYIVNYIYATAYPLTNNRSIFENTCYLGIILSLLRTQLIGMSARHGGIRPETVIKLIQSFTKNFEHMQGFRKLVLDICKDERVDALGPLSLVVMTRKP